MTVIPLDGILRKQRSDLIDGEEEGAELLSFAQVVERDDGEINGDCVRCSFVSYSVWVTAVEIHGRE